MIRVDEHLVFRSVAAGNNAMKPCVAELFKGYHFPAEKVVISSPLRFAAGTTEKPHIVHPLYQTAYRYATMALLAPMRSTPASR